MVRHNNSDLAAGVDGGRTGDLAGDTAEEARLLVMHSLRLKGLATTSDLVPVYGLAHDLVESELDRCCEDGLVMTRSSENRPPSLTLTAEGRTVGEKLLAQELAEASTRRSISVGAQIGELYRRFMPLNRALLETCTQWQVRNHDPLELNDHNDAGYDDAVLTRLQEIHGEAAVICDQLKTLLSRFNRYGVGFNYALGRIDSGAVEWFTKPTIPSYHTLWFELHEDLLATLGLDRAAETARSHNTCQPRVHSPNHQLKD